MHAFSAGCTVTEVISLIFLHKIPKKDECMLKLVRSQAPVFFVKTVNVQKPQGRHQTTSKQKTHFSLSLN